MQYSPAKIWLAAMRYFNAQSASSANVEHSYLAVHLICPHFFVCVPNSKLCVLNHVNIFDAVQRPQKR